MRGADTPLVLAPVVVTGNREPTPLDRIVGDIVVIDAERIRASSADSVEDLLRREGGIQLSRNGGPGQSASVLLRGVSASGMLVLVDGVRIGSATLARSTSPASRCRDRALESFGTSPEPVRLRAAVGCPVHHPSLAVAPR